MSSGKWLPFCLGLNVLRNNSGQKKLEFDNNLWISIIWPGHRYQLNLLCAKFFRESINKYLHFVSYLHIDMMQVVEILPQIRQEPAYFT